MCVSGFLKAFHLLVCNKNFFSIQHDWHFGSHTAFVMEAVLRIIGCSMASLASTQQQKHSWVWEPQIAPDCQMSPRGQSGPWLVSARSTEIGCNSLQPFSFFLYIFFLSSFLFFFFPSFFLSVEKDANLPCFLWKMKKSLLRISTFKDMHNNYTQ